MVSQPVVSDSEAGDDHLDLACGAGCWLPEEFVSNPAPLPPLGHWFLPRSLRSSSFRIFSGHRMLKMRLRQIYDLGSRWAAVLRADSVGQGHLVVNTLPNSPERVVSEAGILLSGAATVNGQYQLADGSDLLHVLHASRAQAIVLDPDVPNSPWQVLKNRVVLEENDKLTSEELPCLQRIFFVRRKAEGDDGDFLSHLKEVSGRYQADVQPGDVMTVFTTSGTTGFSKLVVHTHDLLTTINDSRNPFLHDSDETVDFSLAPLGWLGGYVGMTFLAGYPRVLCDVRAGLPSDMVEFVRECIQEEKCTKPMLMPAILMPLAERVARKTDEHAAEEDKDSSYWTWKPEAIILGGLPVSRTMVKAAMSIGNTVSTGYGATDCSIISSHTVTDAESFVDYDTGTLLHGVQVKVVDPDDEGVLLPAGKFGNILVKRPGMMREYLNNPSATSAAFTPDGFFRTGDIGCLDDRGHLIVHGRGSDAIMRGPYIFYPGWLEDRIRACPGVTNVVVVGVPDPTVNEELCACVELESDRVTLEQVREFVEKDILASEDDPLSPRPRHYLSFASFPRTYTDKPGRAAVKAMAAKVTSQRLG
nr:hypothetical protein BaRGS_007676 [Batillaria attramentaria]